MVTLTREQLEERLVALHKASLELVRDLSLETVLERIVHLAKSQAGASYAALGIVDSEGNIEKFIHIGMSEEDIAKMPHPPVGKGLLGALQKANGTLRIAEISEDPRSSGFPEGHPHMSSFLGVPILSSSRVLGQIYLTNKENNLEFNQDDESVIETLAAYAAIAIENAQLYKGILGRDRILEQRNDDLKLIDDLAQTLANSLEIEDIINQTLNRVISYLGVEAGEIFIREEGSKELSLALHRGESPDAFWTRDRFMIGECFVGRVAQLGKVLVSRNLQEDIRFLRQAVVDAGFLTVACIPLTTRGKIVGVMTVFSRQERKFDERELDLLEATGAWAGTAIENARLHRQARRLAVLEERERIGMDLHDGTIQSMYGVGLALEYARLAMDEEPSLAKDKISQSIEGLNKAIRDIRSYILDLRPREFRGEESIIQGIKRLIEEYKAHTLSEAVLVSPKNGIPKLDIDTGLALFRICQEALANVAKHANAKRTDVHIWTTDERLLLEISDDGSGFDLRRIDVTLGHGLSNMQRRARKVGGDVDISSRPRGGTTVLAWVPIVNTPKSNGDDLYKTY